MDGRSLFFFPPSIVIVGWVDYVPTASVLYKCNPTLPFPFPCVLHECSCNHSTYTISNFFPLTAPATPSLPPSLPRPGPVLRFCQEIETDRRVKRVSCRAAAAAAEALLLRGCDLDNQEELERSQALEPLQLQQCQEGVSCVTQCPI